MYTAQQDRQLLKTFNWDTDVFIGHWKDLAMFSKMDIFHDIHLNFNYGGVLKLLFVQEIDWCNCFSDPTGRLGI